MRNLLSIALFTILVSVLYTGIAQFLPQLENRPPAKVEFGNANITAEDLSAAGSEVFESVCMQCHDLSKPGRGPALGMIGGAAASRAAERGSDYSSVDYLVESLCKPGAYVTEGYGNIMPPQDNALSGGQMQAVVAFLQDQGGVATLVGTDTESFERFGCVSGGGSGGGEAVAAGPEPVGEPDEVFSEFGCAGCHPVVGTTPGVGPSLAGLAGRMSEAEIYQAVLDPDIELADGFSTAEGLMGGTLSGNGFYDRMKASDYRKFVAWLVETTG
jgi:cytochrome c2